MHLHPLLLDSLMPTRDDPRDQFLEKISLTKSFVEYSPSIVFLFGGLVNIRESAPCSVREMFVEYCVSNDILNDGEIRLAEHYKDWFEDSYYSDLLSFEEELSQLASATVVILESPGAIAELGAFCVNKKIRANLVIVISEKHRREKSFITLGPLKKIRPESILVYDWSYDDISSTVPAELPILAADIKDYLQQQSKIEFNPENTGHLSYLVHALIINFQALTSFEITQYLVLLGVRISKEKVERLIYLLTLIDLVKLRPKGNRDFYVALCEKSRITFSCKDSKYRLDYSDLRMGLMTYYSTTDKEDIRLKIIREEMASSKVDVS